MVYKRRVYFTSFNPFEPFSCKLVSKKKVLLESKSYKFTIKKSVLIYQIVFFFVFNSF